MRETELKALVPDESSFRRRLLDAGALAGREGRLEDRRFDLPGRQLTMRDIVLRLRVLRSGATASAWLDWKGAATFEGGYKHREEVSTPVADAGAMAAILTALGYVVTREIDRQVAEFALGGARVRLERFPRMDTLVEVEGPEVAIEGAIAATGIPRESFTTDRLIAFVARYEARTGERAAICERELRGDYSFALLDA